MPKKVVKRTSSRKSRSTVSHKPLLFLVGFLVVGSFLGLSYKLQSHPQVLGASIFLARGGDDSGDMSGSNSGASDSGSSGSNSGSSGSSQPSHSSENTSGSRNLSTVESKSDLPAAALVDCEGPDGKHFSTTFGQCQKLNNAFNKGSFRFTKLSPSHSEASESGRPKENKRTQSLTLKLQGKQQSIRLDKPDEEIQIASTDGKLSVKARESDGTEVGLDDKDSLEKINEALKDEDLHISTSSGKRIAIKRGNTTAISTLPLSIDPATHVLTVTTPQGEKNVAVLPDVAVQNLLRDGVLTSVQNEQTQNGTSQSVELTTLNNKAVFAVNGVSNKKLFGFIPVLLAKKAFISAEDGSVVQVDQTPVTAILNALSF